MFMIRETSTILRVGWIFFTKQNENKQERNQVNVWLSGGYAHIKRHVSSHQ
jgi:hypothetical protein